MKTCHTVPVALGDRSYDIVIGENLLSQVEALLLPFIAGHQACIITDEHIGKIAAADLQAEIQNAGISCRVITVKAGEQSKSFASFEDVLEALLSDLPDRKTTLIALGGGVVGDLTGFVASVLLRGVPFIQIPTTLLSQVDSSVGGKTAINSRYGKNLVGSFYQPSLVLADVAMLDSLPERELRSGYAEVVKYGLIDQPEFFDWLELNASKVVAGNHEALMHVVRVSCQAKAAIVAADEHEKDQRALLNLGHTFGHALEKATGYGDALRHGEAVAIGMCWAFMLSERLGYCSAEDVVRVCDHLDAVGLPVSVDGIDGDFHAETLLKYMYGDKKTSGGQLNLILAKGIGKAFVAKDVSPDLILELLQHVCGGH